MGLSPSGSRGLAAAAALALRPSLAPCPRRRALLALAALCSPAAAWAADDDEGSVEYQVKAAFVCKFASYVDWPPHALPGAGEPLRLGVLGSGAVADEFRRTAVAMPTAGRPVEVKRLARGEALTGLHVVFVSRAMSAQAAEVIAATQGRPVLTVTEITPPGPMGMINFVVIDDKVRFDILLAPAAQSGLRISARLLGVARRVEGRS